VNRSIGLNGIRNDSPDRTSSGNPRVRGAFDELGSQDVILDLLTETDLLPLLRSAFGGELTPVRSAQIRLCFPSEESDVVDIDMGVRNDHIPYNGWNGHVG
jgi:hypothetical protein